MWRICETGFDGDRCFAEATVEEIGDGHPLWSACYVSLVAGGGILGVSQRRYDDVRRIECDAEWHIYPAPELAAVANGETVQVSTLTAGILLALPTILGSPPTARAAATTRPQIARVRKTVARAGPVTIPLRLNAAAKRLLKQKRKLAVSLQITFTGNDGRQLSRTRKVTLTAPHPRPRTCRVPRPKKPPKRLPRCAIRP